MKKIEAIIRPERLGAVRAAVGAVGYEGLTISDVRGHGRQRGVQEQYKGTAFTVDILPKIKIEMVTGDDSVPALVAAIKDAAYTGVTGDGKIFVSTMDDAIRVRTGESGMAAL